ncbi:MAG: hypothetical protein AAFY26_01210 [Cyanobacteria bacterium J06638_22]
MVISIVLSVGIRYGASRLEWSPTLPLVLGMILLPSLLVALALGWRSQRPTDVSQSGEG